MNKALLAMLLDKYSYLLGQAISELESKLPTDMKSESTLPFDSDKSEVIVTVTQPLWFIQQLIEYDIDRLKESHKHALTPK